VRLANAVGSIGGLVFYGRVSPRGVVDHGVGLRQVQAHTIGFKTDEKDGHHALVNCCIKASRFTGLTRELDPVEAILFNFSFNQGEHSGELSKQQYTQPLGQQLHQLLRLAEVLTFCVAASFKRRGSQQTWRSLSASNIAICDLAKPLVLRAQFFPTKRPACPTTPFAQFSPPYSISIS
jgi:hypothetical protein